MATLFAGCRTGGRIEPVSIPSRWFGPMTIAVAPAVNLSGSSDFDATRFADLMASELGHADGVTVIPVSRVLAVFATQGVASVRSPSHAMELVSLLGADAILVFAVSEYDPYEPPSIGISAQLFGVRSRPGDGALDPVALSRQTTLATMRSGAPSRGLLVQTQRVFDATHQSVVDEIRSFAAKRGGDASPYGWRKYVVSQQSFIRFCCYSTITALLQGPRQRDETGSERPKNEGMKPW